MLKRVAIAVALLLAFSACGDDEAPSVKAAEVPAWAKVAPEQIAEAKKHGVPVAFENDLGMRFVLIPAGTFLMGSPEGEVPSEAEVAAEMGVAADGEADDEEEGEVEEVDLLPQHEVTLTKPFYLATTENTQAVWREVMHENPSYEQGRSLPVEGVSWEDCQTFVKRLNETIPGAGYRLPTEAEWECACRAGTATRYWSGETEEDLARVGWYSENSAGQTHRAGTKPANPWGLFNMHGNVWEWCQDRHESYGEVAVTDPLVKGPGDRVLRGGSLNFPASLVRSAFRIRMGTEGGPSWAGFRLARDVTPERPQPAAPQPKPSK